MTTYLVDGVDLGSIADAIRLKGGTTASLAFPSAFVSAINAIQTGEIVSHVGDEAATSIASSAYQSMWYITEASFPMATTIGSYAFQDCYALSSVNFASNLIVGSSAFIRAYCLMTIPKTMASIGAQAFANCTNLSAITLATLSNGVSIGTYAFLNCTRLSSIRWGGSSNYIGAYAFEYCTNLPSSFTISAAKIGIYAFAYCRGLKSVTIYMGGTSGFISGNVFANCYNLSYVKISAKYVPTGASTIFSNTPIAASSYNGAWGSIYVPSSLYTSFRTAAGWSAYSARIKSY